MAVPTPQPDLSGHIALVTGANHGIGAATARLMVGAGAKVAIGEAVFSAYLDLRTGE